MASRGLIRDVVNYGLKLESANVEIVREILATARNKLAKELKDNPDLIGSREFEKVLETYLDEVNQLVPEKFKSEESLKEGIREGKTFLGDSARIDKDSNFWGWTPVLPINAIGLADSEMANLIRKTTDQLKEKTLRTVQVGLASGASIGEIQTDILGLGIKGLKGRDGVWRTATFRAEMQARTITNDLINRGAMITYTQIDNQIPELEIKKVWQTVSDRRTSERCKSLNGQKRELKEEFRASDGWTGDAPPSHPNCRSRVTTLSKTYINEWDKRLDPTEPKQSPKPPKVKLNKNPRKATKTSINPLAPKLNKGDAEFSNPLYSLEEFNRALADLAQEDPEMGKRIKMVADFQKNNNLLMFAHDDNYLKGQKEKFLDLMVERFNEGKYNSPLSPISFRDSLEIELEEVLGFTGDEYPFIMLRTDRLENKVLNFKAQDIKDNFKIVNSRLENARKYYKSKFAPDPKEYLRKLSQNTVAKDEKGYNEQVSLLATYIHEMGHQVQHKVKRYKLPGGFHYTDLPSVYAGYNSKEAFAECFTQYILDPEGLERNSPSMYGWVDSIWREANGDG